MPDELDADDAASHSSGHTWSVRTITIPWTNPVPDSLNGIIHVLAHNTPIKVDGREALLITIAKARHWIEDLTHGRVASFVVEGTIQNYEHGRNEPNITRLYDLSGAGSPVWNTFAGV